MEAALEVGILDAVSFYHAGVISKASGNPTAAKKYFQQSLDTNAHSEVADAARYELD
jgi:hypothetical protein